MIGVLLVAIFILLCVFMFWIVYKEGQWLSWMMNAANEAPLINRLLMSATVLCVGLVWFMSRS